MVVLERKSSPGAHNTSPALWYHDTVAIAGLNAIARARATFQPRGTPNVGPVEPLLSPREAYVVHGLVYYLDGLGQVWTMGVNGKQTAVARFPITPSRQEISFAVSPDGCQIAATVLTVPATTEPWKLETMMATVGGATQVLQTWTSTAYPDAVSGGDVGLKNLVLMGWDAVGPLVVVSSPLGTQNGDVVDNFDFFDGSVAHLTAQGGPGPTVTIPGGCLAVKATAAGDIACVTQGVVGALWVYDSSGRQEAGPLTVTNIPDVAIGPGGLVALTGEWIKGNTNGKLPANFEPEGWIDANTIFGRIGTFGSPAGNAALAHIVGSGATVENLGFQGDFVGMLSA